MKYRNKSYHRAAAAESSMERSHMALTQNNFLKDRPSSFVLNDDNEDENDDPDKQRAYNKTAAIMD